MRWRKIELPAIGLILFTVLPSMGYYLRDQGSLRPTASPPPAMANAPQLRAILETGTTQQRLGALRQLIEMRAEPELTRCLTSVDPAVVQLAITGLWECWLEEAGPDARRVMDEGIEAMGENELSRAASLFRALVESYPRWAEAINKLATVFYLQGLPEESIALCRQVVALKPDHFGAWNGMAICAIQTEDWALALQAVNESLRLQPHSLPNLQLFKLVQSRLRSV